MSANDGVRSRVTIELIVAGGIMIVSAASIATLVLATPAGGAVTTPQNAPARCKDMWRDSTR